MPGSSGGVAGVRAGGWQQSRWVLQAALLVLLCLPASLQLCMPHCHLHEVMRHLPPCLPPALPAALIEVLLLQDEAGEASRDPKEMQ